MYANLHSISIKNLSLKILIISFSIHKDISGTISWQLLPGGQVKFLTIDEFPAL